ncbi:hypothetical protein GCM10011591_39370 [Nocardia camponoti]|uniref:Uncharacterized protein n=1 Tax=Nocardia camponoti TaxID=1616106 RepID=A0A917VC63_9NOCA|nr:hypothetical protein GCM10011591_39370 [Nocardia camponoti]
MANERCQRTREYRLKIIIDRAEFEDDGASLYHEQLQRVGNRDRGHVARTKHDSCTKIAGWGKIGDRLA